MLLVSNEIINQQTPSSSEEKLGNKEQNAVTVPKFKLHKESSLFYVRTKAIKKISIFAILIHDI